MRLTNEDKKYLNGLGYTVKDFKQIEEAMSKTVYELDDKRISRKKAIELLGRTMYLSGISRSAFHWSACREIADGQTVYFDSSKLFKVK